MIDNKSIEQVNQETQSILQCMEMLLIKLNMLDGDIMMAFKPNADGEHEALGVFPQCHNLPKSSHKKLYSIAYMRAWKNARDGK